MAKGMNTLDTGADPDLRVYKKTSPNSLLTLYLGTRDVICRQGIVEPLRGVIYIDPKFTPSNKIYGQLTLTFRYGREDEEVMGLKFCNEAIIALKQIWPVPENSQDDLSPLQRALLERLGKNAFPFSLDVGALAPPSVQLVPAKRYNGAPIGTSYDVRIHMAGDQQQPPDERPATSRRCMVKLGVRVIHKIASSVRCTDELTTAANVDPAQHAVLLPKTLRLRLSPKAQHQQTDEQIPGNSSNIHARSQQQRLADESADEQVAGDNDGGGSQSRIDIERGTAGNDSKGAEGSVDKPFLWTEGRVSLRAALNKSAYGHGEHISVTIDVRNDSRKIIRKIRIFAVQHVDVCMFSNGKFKNIVAEINESLLIKPNERHRKVYSLLPIRGPTKNWIAVEGIQSHTGIGSGGGDATGASSSHTPAATLQPFSYKIASSAPRGSVACTEDRNVFAIYVSYYIKVKLTLSAMGGEVTLKLPFILGHVEDNHRRTSLPPTIKATTVPGDDKTIPPVNNPMTMLSSSKVAASTDNHSDQPKKNDATDDVSDVVKRCTHDDDVDGVFPAKSDRIVDDVTVSRKTVGMREISLDEIVAEAEVGNIEHLVPKCQHRAGSVHKSDVTDVNDTQCNNVVTAQVHSSAN